MRVTYSIRNFSLAARCFHPPTIPSSILHSHTVYHVPCTQHPAYMYEEYSLIFIPFVVVALFSAVGRRYKKKFRYCLCFMVCSVPSGLNGCSTHCPCNSCKPTPKSEWKKKHGQLRKNTKKKLQQQEYEAPHTHRNMNVYFMIVSLYILHTHRMNKNGGKEPVLSCQKVVCSCL